jgi:CheY-like chemotaxis protein
MKIFYADDDADEIEFFCEAVKSVDASVECITACDGGKALHLLEKITTPDVIFLDMNMPVVNGADCLSKIKNNPRLKHVPVIIYSSSLQQNQVENLRRAGAFKIIDKRYGTTQLRLELRSLIPRLQA